MLTTKHRKIKSFSQDHTIIKVVRPSSVSSEPSCQHNSMRKGREWRERLSKRKEFVYPKGYSEFQTVPSKFFSPSIAGVCAPRFNHWIDNKVKWAWLGSKTWKAEGELGSESYRSMLQLTTQSCVPQGVNFQSQNRGFTSTAFMGGIGLSTWQPGANVGRGEYRRFQDPGNSPFRGPSHSPKFSCLKFPCSDSGSASTRRGGGEAHRIWFYFKCENKPCWEPFACTPLITQCGWCCWKCKVNIPRSEFLTWDVGGVAYSVSVCIPHDLDTEIWQLLAIEEEPFLSPTVACPPGLWVFGPVSSESTLRPSLQCLRTSGTSRPMVGALLGQEP